MRRQTSLRPLTRFGAALTGAALLSAACAPGDQPSPDEDPAPSAASDVDYPDGPFEREGVSGGGSRQFHSTFRVDEVVGHSDRTVVRFTVLVPGDDGELIMTSDAFDGSPLGAFSHTPIGLRLIDPVEQRLYYPARDGDVFVGSEIAGAVISGASYRMEAHFPPLPAGTPRVTLAVPGTQGMYTGLPVEGEFEAPWDPAEAPNEAPPHHRDVEPGDEIVMPVSDGEVTGQGHDLHSIVESTETVRETSASEHRVDLDADVLFEFDEAELTEQAARTLDEVAAETREKADPDLPPITIVGHTDGVGDDDYNQTLSQERAEAVRAYLEDELGSDYEYESEGRGSTEPVAEEGEDDDEEARARNRRVEISYNILREERQTTTSEEETVSALVGTGHVAAPARFLAEEGEPLATAAGTNGQGFDYTLDVHSLRRDGAFVVAAVTLSNDSGRRINPTTGAHFWERGNRGGRFSSFGVVDPSSGDVYRSVRIGEPDSDGDSSYVEPQGFPYRFDEDTDNQAHLYFPAPPLDVDTVDLEAGPFGTLDGLPLS